MKTRALIISFAIILNISSIWGQIRPDSSQLTALETIKNRFENSIDFHWNEKTGKADIINLGKPCAFAKDPKESAQNFLQEIGSVLKKREKDDNFAFERSQKNGEVSYISFNQEYKGIPVLEGEYVVMVLPNGKV
jgi:hypothetical protein